LFGICSNDGVIISTYADQVFASRTFHSVAEIRDAMVEAGLKRVRPALMTTACSILALIPVLTSQGKGSDVMVPMALPTFGGMTIDMITIFVVLTIYCWMKLSSKGTCSRLIKQRSKFDNYKVCLPAECLIGRVGLFKRAVAETATSWTVEVDLEATCRM
jgi:Cu(I)/Ag(I) efflux system membrane protein CusA/SilA